MREMHWLDAVHFVASGKGVNCISTPEEGSPVGVCSSSRVHDKPLESGDAITIRMYNI